MKSDILSKIEHVSVKIHDIFKSKNFGSKSKAVSGESYVFSLTGDKKLYVMTSFFVLTDDAYDGAYYSYNFDYIPLDSAVSGKRGVKVKKAIMSYSSMNNPEREVIDDNSICIVGKVKLNYLPEKVKIIEKEGWKI